MRMASSSSCNLCQKEVDRMKKENIIVLASTVWMEDDNCDILEFLPEIL